MPLTNQLAGFFKLEYLKDYLNYKVYFLHVIRYSRKLLFDYITIAGGGGGGGGTKGPNNPGIVQSVLKKQFPNIFRNG